jgi:hypothetical protein
MITGIIVIFVIAYLLLLNVDKEAHDEAMWEEAFDAKWELKMIREAQEEKAEREKEFQEEQLKALARIKENKSVSKKNTTTKVIHRRSIKNPDGTIITEEIIKIEEID